MTDERTSPLERLLDMVVFGPAGLAITAVEEFPKLAAKGRHRIEGQVHTARVVGQFAVQMGRRQLDERLRRMSGPPGSPAGSRPAATHEATEDVERGPRSREPLVAETRRAVSSNGSAPTPEPAPAGPPVELAIPGYDSLSASQVVQRLGGLTREELEEIGAHERANRHRRTILNRVDQLLQPLNTVTDGMADVTAPDAP